MFSLFSVGSTIESICALFALIFLIRDKNSFWKITVAYMLIVPSTELFAKYIGRIYHNNLIIYNIYMLVELSYITYAFYIFLKDFIDAKRFLLPIFAIIIAIYIGFSITHNPIIEYNSITISIMSVVFVVYGLLYFYFLLKDDKYIDLKFHPAFWWVGGAIIFYFGGTLANFFDEIIQQKFLGKYNTRSIIYSTLNVLLYCFWSYSFICRARQRTICP
ncbi:hypothetical protein [Pedobacter aquatilis]|uniref:hypothetical protein n=1 Tax=Pedobacter aquatilis TaxID=351343 RepID=UPI00292D4153|nr:hypothetical protein [Pedobacter aquatilis]